MNRIAVFFLFLIFSVNSFSQNKLSQSKNELNSGSRSGSESVRSSSSYSSSSSSYRNDSFWADIFVDFFAQGLLWLTVGNHSGEEHLSNFYTPYPYFNGYSGNYSQPEYDRKSPVRFTIENNIYDPFMHKTFANRLKGRVNFRHFGFQSDWLQMHEEFPKTKLAMVNLSFCYDRLRFQRFNWGWNMGANFIGSGVNSFGFSIGTTAEAFLFKRAALYASLKGGRVNKQPVNQFEIRAKRYISKFFISAGYETLKIATPRYHYITAGAGVCL